MRRLATHALTLFVLSGTSVSCAPPTAPAVEPGQSQAAAPGPTAGTPPATPSNGEAELAKRRAELKALLAEQWEYVMQRYPEYASAIGDHRYDDRWSDQSPQAIAQDLEQQRLFLERFSKVDTTGFPEQEVLNQALMARGLKESLDNARFEDWLMPVNQMSGPHIDLPRMVSILRFANTKDYENYAARLKSLPVVLEQTVALMRAGLAKQLLPPREQLKLCLDQVSKLGLGKLEASPFAQPIAKFPEGVPAADQTRLRAEISETIKNQVLPAYRKLSEFLSTEYVPHGRKDPGVWALPDGNARYAAQVKNMTTTELTPAEIHEIGLKEVARIEAEQEAIGKTLNFKDLAAFRQSIRNNRKLYATSRQDILDRYQKSTDQMYAQLPKLFGRLPAQKIQILPMEEFREKDSAGADYQQGTPDGRPGIVRVNTATPTKRLWLDMESTAYHEGVPGHHLQLSIQMELTELPPFRQFGGYSAFFEGWALYSERLGKEVGFFQDPYSDYGRLQDELLRAIRLVVDTGLHSKKWTRDQVVKFFHDHSTIDEPSVQAETNRYIVWPGQALAYKIGQLTVLRIRDKAKATLGARFDIRAFHDTVLSAGALPLDLLEARVDAWARELAGKA